MANTVDRAKRILEGRLEELEAEAARLRAAIQSLESSAAHRDTAPEAHPKRAGKQTRAPRGERQRQLLESIESNPGKRVAEHADALGVRPQQLYPLLQRLEANGSIVKSKDGYRPAKTPAAT